MKLKKKITVGLLSLVISSTLITEVGNANEQNTPKIKNLASNNTYGSASWLNNYPLNYKFGRYNLSNNGGIHYGVDFGMAVGTPVKAITAGTVINTAWDPYGGGNTITVKESDGIHTQWYMHLSKFNVKKGQKISVGQIIAYSGNTGQSTGPHLHFQRMKGNPSNSNAIDPLPFLKSIGYGKNNGNTQNKPNTNPSTSGGFKVNKYGTLYKNEKATFTANTTITTRYTGPFRSMPKAGSLKKGQSIKYDEVMKQDGHVWVAYTDSSKKRIYVPVRTWNKNNNSLGNLWGSIK
ncbi:TPA: peptidoglycan DD-metalloendopeptidase family protein [Staphylococcus aureus]|nr:peptidoglycan DD-metalloendopeptidase family protein [Staphylococcus aureus]HDA6194750.1 peptidoglycan DD-metalloendopeptidase family protein [Staphylococcus aureus]HDE4302758.1 peptidoglycan DD-metalloendopeptidase family protein [Staphylococcus aureus]HDH4312525.1 peptidoglycan DD-metalloendopeptidase family protein [Staphylococcus aureus]HDH4320567.1 peptidoglycan DD-metalloendopeptidase family protein [Staphylococcus aureus]